MTQFLRTRLKDAEARRRDAEREVVDLLDRLLAEVGLELVQAERSGVDRWMLTVRLDSAALTSTAEREGLQENPSQLAAESQVEPDAVAGTAEETPETLDPPSAGEGDVDLPAVTDEPEQVIEEEEAALDAGDALKTATDEAEPSPFLSPADDAPALGTLPELPAFEGDTPSPAKTDVSSAGTREAGDADGPAEDEPLGLPPLPPLALLDDDEDDTVLSDRPAGEVSAPSTVEFLGAPPPPLPTIDPGPPQEEKGPADLETLLRNGRSDLRVKSGGNRRKNPFKQSSTDPRSRAERLARTLVSDMIAYAPDKHAATLQKGIGAIREEFEAEIETARIEYYAQVDESLSERDAIFRKAVNDLLGNGQQVLAEV